VASTDSINEVSPPPAAAAPPQPAAAPGDRRRPGRLQIDNPHLIAVLRKPEAGPPPERYEPRFSFAWVILAAAMFWGLVVAGARALF
jgi:hypothetical protein